MSEQARHTQEEMTAYAGAVRATVNGRRMYLASCTCNDLPADEQEANARLFAASPDLLAACEAFLRTGKTPADIDAAYEAARAAIRKATGGT